MIYLLKAKDCLLSCNLVFVCFWFLHYRPTVGCNASIWASVVKPTNFGVRSSELCPVGSLPSVTTTSSSVLAAGSLPIPRIGPSTLQGDNLLYLLPVAASRAPLPRRGCTSEKVSPRSLPNWHQKFSVGNSSKWLRCCLNFGLLNWRTMNRSDPLPAVLHRSPISLCGFSVIRHMWSSWLPSSGKQSQSWWRMW